MFDMNQCIPGDKLISCHGTMLEYIGINERAQDMGTPYRHGVKYPDGATGTRCDDGFVFTKNRLPCDENIVGFYPGYTREGLKGER